jgi:hypothetical protein
MADGQDEPRTRAWLLTEVNARLSRAAETGAPLELILTLRGRISPVPGKHGERWRLRTGRGHVVTFRPEFVVAFNGTEDAHQGTPRSVQGR